MTKKMNLEHEASVLEVPAGSRGRWEGGWKKHENLMKKQCKNGCFLMARHHVWRYTLRLFHTFVLFEKNRKNDAKRDAKSRVF